MRSFFDVIRGWQGSAKRIFYYGKKKTKKSKKWVDKKVRFLYNKPCVTNE